MAWGYELGILRNKTYQFVKSLTATCSPGNLNGRRGLSVSLSVLFKSVFLVSDIMKGFALNLTQNDIISARTLQKSDLPADLSSFGCLIYSVCEILRIQVNKCSDGVQQKASAKHFCFDQLTTAQPVKHWYLFIKTSTLLIFLFFCKNVCEPIQNMHGHMRNIIFTTPKKKNVAWVQRNLRFNNKSTVWGNKQPNQTPPGFKHGRHPNIQDRLQIIHRTSYHSKYTIFSSVGKSEKCV